jgi:hypothetical protein
LARAAVMNGTAGAAPVLMTVSTSWRSINRRAAVSARSARRGSRAPMNGMNSTSSSASSDRLWGLSNVTQRTGGRTAGIRLCSLCSCFRWPPVEATRSVLTVPARSPSPTT